MPPNMNGMPPNMADMMNNPMVKEMMSNPEMMKMASQMMANLSPETIKMGTNMAKNNPDMFKQQMAAAG